MKKKVINKYLVPFDFTNATKDAYKYALSFANVGGGEVMLLHIVDAHSKILEAEQEIQRIIKEESKENQAMTTFRVMKGSIVEDINTIAEAFSASAIIMGSHGRSGLQKIFGSNALGVVTESNIPFIITQENQTKDTVDKIVLPFNFSRESLQITQFATSLASKFDATIYLAAYAYDDESLIKDTKINQAIVQKHLIKHGVKYEIVTLPNDQAFEKELIKFAEEINADLIAAAYFDRGLRSLFFSFVDELFENKAKIPVLTVNGPDVMNYSATLEYFPI